VAIFEGIKVISQGRQGAVDRELTLSGIKGLPAPEAAITDWYRMCDELTLTAT
jgi:hypothetical protein